MQKHSFTLGAIAGMTSLALAVPLVAQVAGAQTGDTTPTPPAPTPPTQECIQAMIALNDAHIAHIDEQIARQKEMLQRRSDGLASVALISDDAERLEALQQLRKDLQPDDNEHTVPANIQAAQDALHDACGSVRGFGGPGMMHGHMRGPAGFGNTARGPFGQDQDRRSDTAGAYGGMRGAAMRR